MLPSLLLILLAGYDATVLAQEFCVPCTNPLIPRITSTSTTGLKRGSFADPGGILQTTAAGLYVSNDEASTFCFKRINIQTGAGTRMDLCTITVFTEFVDSLTFTCADLAASKSGISTTGVQNNTLSLSYSDGKCKPGKAAITCSLCVTAPGKEMYVWGFQTTACSCCVDCIVGLWGKWSRCSASCGSGLQIRRRSITKQPSACGQRCPAKTESLVCSSPPCYAILACSVGQVGCADGQQCINSTSVCNNIYDCTDRSDEYNCGNRSLPFICTFNDGVCGMAQEKCSYLWTVSSRMAYGTPRNGSFLYVSNFIASQDTFPLMEILRLNYSGKACLSAYMFVYNIRPSSLPNITIIQRHSKDIKATIALAVIQKKNQWQYVKLALDIQMNDSIGFQGFLPKFTYTSALAVDDFKIFPGPCPEGCFPGERQCFQPMCVSSYQFCDGYIDCLDSFDEVGCACSAAQVRCDMGLCIPRLAWCDGTPDCPDWSDEKRNCDCLDADSYKCYKALGDFRCLPRTKIVCNGKIDCMGAADEINCTCTPAQFRCLLGMCIPQSSVCDGQRQCMDWSDEFNCNASCSDPQVECNVSSVTGHLSDIMCLPSTYVCNGIDDCPQGEDERNCPVVPVCSPGQFLCINGFTCLEATQLCDGINDCDFGEDEANCSCSLDIFNVSPGDVFHCSDGTHCTTPKLVCNGVDHCPDGSDESPTLCSHWTAPPATCAPSDFQCPVSGYCVGQFAVCDGGLSCVIDGQLLSYDEVNCSCSVPFGFRTVLFHCSDPNFCTALAAVCDGIRNCPDGSDESPAHCACSGPYGRGFQCANGACISAKLVCNGYKDCNDSSDEKNCSRTVCSPLAEFSCSNGQSCVKRGRVCDGIADCSDRSDEFNCSQCVNGTVLCVSESVCLDASTICDGIINCRGGADELNCGSCLSSQFQCLMTYQCVPLSAVCDGQAQCSDASDEYNCVHLTSDGILQIHVNQQYLPVCADQGFDMDLANQACRQAGNAGAVTVSSVSPVSGSTTFAQVNGSQSIHIQAGAVAISSCSSLVHLQCAPFQCGQGGHPLNAFAHVIAINGGISKEHAWPWAVSLQSIGQHYCGGVILNEYWILTAAHCLELDSSPVQNFQVVSGGNYYSGADIMPTYRTLSAAIIHPGYEVIQEQFAGFDEYFAVEFDIALVKLTSPLTMDHTTQAICLPTTGRVATSRACYTAGWGQITPEELAPPVPSNVLRESKVVSLDLAECYQQYGSLLQELAYTSYSRTPFSDDQHICTQTNRFNILCSGDSGGSLMCVDEYNRWTTYGVASYLPGDKCNLFTVFSNVTSYVDWIQYYINHY